MRCSVWQLAVLLAACSGGSAASTTASDTNSARPAASAEGSWRCWFSDLHSRCFASEPECESDFAEQSEDPDLEISGCKPRSFAYCMVACPSSESPCTRRCSVDLEDCEWDEGFAKGAFKAGGRIAQRCALTSKP